MNLLVLLVVTALASVDQKTTQAITDLINKSVEQISDSTKDAVEDIKTKTKEQAKKTAEDIRNKSQKLSKNLSDKSTSIFDDIFGFFKGVFSDVVGFLKNLFGDNTPGQPALPEDVSAAIAADMDSGRRTGQKLSALSFLGVVMYFALFYIQKQIESEQKKNNGELLLDGYYRNIQSLAEEENFL